MLRALAACLVLVAGCGSSVPSQAPMSAALPQFVPCMRLAAPAPNHTLCAQITHLDSRGSETDLQVALVADRATDPLRDRSLLVYHPGGPGLWTTRVATATVPLLDFTKTVALSWDGTTSSTSPGACGAETTTFGTARAPFAPGIQALDVATDCLVGFGGPLDVGAIRAAQELELIRASLAVAQLDMLMVSYGTAIGEAYLRLYPDRVRRAVLDAPVAMEAPWNERVARVGEVLEAAADDLAGACDVGRCRGMNEDGAPLTYRELRAAILAQEPIAGAGRGLLTGVMLDQATLLVLRDPSSVEAFATAADAALGGDGTQLWAMGETYFFDLDRSVFYRSLCADIDRPADARDYVALGRDLLSTYTSELAPCAGFPYRGPPEAVSGGDPDVLIVTSTKDVLTPASLLDSAPVLTGLGAVCRTNLAGHTSSGDAATRAVILDFLRDGDAVSAAGRCDALD
jgi:pimeloyl-ACP methyl ester carboxylesterase